MRMLYPLQGLATLSGLFGKTRQGWYQWASGLDETVLFDALVAQMAIDIRSEMNNMKLGTSKLLLLINEQLDLQGLHVGRDRLYAILRERGLLIRRRRRRAVTTNSNHLFKRYPNLIKERVLNQPEEVWVSDITYLRLEKGFAYLSLITDAYSRKIMGYCLHPTLAAEGPQKALMMAFTQRHYPDHKLIHHSDQGIQYCSYDYVQLLKSNGIAVSMTKGGSPQENAIAERINGILKQEYELHKTFGSIEQAQKAVAQGIASYNEKRPHRSLEMQTPDQVHRKLSAEHILQVQSEDRNKEQSVKLQ